MNKRWALLLLFGLFAALKAWTHSAQPPLNANDWNFVLVPSFESDPAPGNNLSAVGLNHALRFGQLLDTLVAGKRYQLRQVYALSFEHNSSIMEPLETIEPFAVLNNLGVKALRLNAGGPSTYDSPGYFIKHILAEKPRGIYVMAMPRGMIRDIVTALTGTPIEVESQHQYLAVSGGENAFKVKIYCDGIANVIAFPQVSLPPRAICKKKPVTFVVKAPHGWRPYTSQIVYLVRHVEAHPNSTFENGNYVCRGQWRALGADSILLKLMHEQIPNFVFTSDPTNVIDCGSACSYVRASLTVAPFAIQHHLPLTLARFQWGDAIDLAQALFNQGSPYFHHPSSGAIILVGWEHAHIEKAVKYLLTSMYGDPKAARQLPQWTFGDYDTVWELSTDKRGNLTFRNTCEGIRTADLPSTCPAFWQ